MNNNEAVKVSVRHLQVGDVTTGSGITITHRPYTSVRCPARKLWVEGVRDNGTPFLGCWGADTTVSVIR